MNVWSRHESDQSVAPTFSAILTNRAWFAFSRLLLDLSSLLFSARTFALLCNTLLFFSIDDLLSLIDFEFPLSRRLFSVKIVLFLPRILLFAETSVVTSAIKKI